MIFSQEITNTPATVRPNTTISAKRKILIDIAVHAAPLPTFFIFYKECLVNITHHSGATKYMTELKATAETIHLKICDNGRGRIVRIKVALRLHSSAGRSC